jgi:hypothetical protein
MTNVKCEKRVWLKRVEDITPRHDHLKIEPPNYGVTGTESASTTRFTGRSSFVARVLYVKMGAARKSLLQFLARL